MKTELIEKFDRASQIFRRIHIDYLNDPDEGLTERLGGSLATLAAIGDMRVVIELRDWEGAIVFTLETNHKPPYPVLHHRRTMNELRDDGFELTEDLEFIYLVLMGRMFKYQNEQQTKWEGRKGSALTH